MKKLSCILLSICMVLSMAIPIVHANEVADKKEIVETEVLDALDILIAAFRILAATDDDGGIPIWDSITDIATIEPLYNMDREVIAFYLSFEPNGYVIINNNIANPVIMEFSTSSYTELDILIEKKRDIQNQDDDRAYICYGGASNLFTISDALIHVDSMSASARSSVESVLQIEDFYSFMNSINVQEYNKHMALRDMIEEKHFLSSANMQLDAKSSYTVDELKVMYGMIDWSNMPTDASYYTKTIQGGANIDYGTTGEFSGVNGAQNHCAATAAFNVIAYYSVYLDIPELFVDDDREGTFTAIHEYIGNGPVLFDRYNNGLADYAEDRGRTYHYERGGTYSLIKDGINSNHMSTILLTSSITSWHMVNAVGYREYSTGTKYIRIVNGWENTANRFILSNNIVGSYTTWIT